MSINLYEKHQTLFGDEVADHIVISDRLKRVEFLVEKINQRTCPWNIESYCSPRGEISIIIKCGEDMFSKMDFDYDDKTMASCLTAQVSLIDTFTLPTTNLLK